ncbi:MAG TPA: CpsB/CapC family capsule biosynthesis tyrosine phosphatase [Longimicrobiales bacterium]
MPEATASPLADLHNHLVPAVDDGARSTDESLEHLRALARDGVRRLAVSPHLDARLVHDPGDLSERLDRLRSAFHELVSACAGRGDVPRLQFGQEILVPDRATAAAAFAAARLGIEGTRYALVEFGFDLGDDPPGVVRAILETGVRPIVAHPERYRRNGEPVGVEEIRAWKAAGALLQLNGGSVLGGYGEGIEALAWRLLQEGLVDLISTDHHADARPVSPAEVGRRLAARGAAAQGRLLLSENPLRILDDRDVLPVPRWTAAAVA